MFKLLYFRHLFSNFYELMEMKIKKKNTTAYRTIKKANSSCVSEINELNNQESETGF